VAVKYPNNGELLYRLTEVYCELGDIKRADALLMLNRFGNSKQNLVWHKASQGRIHEARNDADLAMTAYMAAHMVNDENAHVNLALGRLLFKETDFHSAIAFLNAANALDPVNMQPLVLKAKSHQELGNNRDAVEIYEHILNCNPKLTEITLAAADIKAGQGDMKGAIKTLNSGLAFSPKDANLLFQLGKLYQSTKQYDLAINAYQSSIGRKADSRNVESLRVIGEIYYTKLTNEKKAVEYFKKYVRAGGKDSKVDYLIKKINGKG